MRMFSRRIIKIIIIAFICLFTSFTLSGWCNSKDQILNFPLKPANTSSPEETLESFISNMNKAYFYIKKASDEDMKHPNTGLFHSDKVLNYINISEMYFKKSLKCLDLSKVPEIYLKDISYEAALQLKEILDRIEIPTIEEIRSGNFFKTENNGKIWRIPNTEVRISMETEGKDAGQFLFTSDILKNIKSFYKSIKELPYKSENTSQGFYEFYIKTPGLLYPPKWLMGLPDWTQKIIFNQTLWQWAFLLIVIILFTSIYFTVFKFCTKAFQKASPTSQSLAKFIFPVAIVIIVSLSGKLINDVINITGSLLMIILGTLNIIKILALGWGVFLLGGLFSEIAISSPKMEPTRIDASLVRTLSKLVSMSLGLMVLIDGANDMGLSIVPIITSLGVVGLAFSLAAKPTVENIIGGITLFADKTVKVGEYCHFGNISGTIVNIGIRSTRIRTLDRTIVSIPNGDLSQITLDNISRRDKYPFAITLGVRYETTKDQLTEVMSAIKEMILAHPKTNKKEPVRVFFGDFGEYSLDINIKSYINTRDLMTFLSTKEELLLAIMNILEEKNVSLAFPSQTNYVAKDSLPSSS